MGETLSAAAGFVGVIVPALHGARLLRKDIEDFVDAPKAIASLKDDLVSVDLAIEGLKAVKPTEWESLGQPVVKQSEFAVRTCKTACEAFRHDLLRWTKHSKDGKLSFRDRVNVGFFQEQKIKTLSAQLQNCKITVNGAASTATLHSSLRQTGMTDKLKTAMEEEQVQMTAAIAALNLQIAEVEKRQVSITDVAPERDEAEEKVGVLKQIDEERGALNESRKLFEELLAKTQQQTGIVIKNIRIKDKGSHVLTGMINTQNKYVNPNLNISDVEASSGGKAIAGIAEGVPLDKFFD